MCEQTELTKTKRFFNGLKKVISFLFPPKNPAENILQYFMRQLLVADAKGNPSFTTTILAYVMILVGIVTYVEMKNAQILVAGKPVGFTDTFLYLIIGLSIVITGWYRQRQKKQEGVDGQPSEPDAGTLSTIKTYVEQVVQKFVK